MKSFTRSLVTLACAVLSAAAGFNALADGISGSGIVKYFHSVVIDGVHYQTDGAIIRLNGEPAAEADLKVGYHVSYRADGETLQVWSMDYYDTVAGPVESVRIIDADMQVARIRMLGQTVVTDADTWLHGVSLAELEPGMNVAVSAEWLPNGELLASSVDATTRPVNVLSGPIGRLDEFELRIGAATVDVTATGLLVNGEALQPEEWVHVLGYFDGVVLHAERLVRMADRGITILPATVEGALRREGGRWHLRDLTLAVEALAGNPGLRPGLRATVSGLLKPDGTLEAGRVRVEEKRRERLDGMIEAVHAQGAAITVAGRRIRIDERTSLRDDRDGYRWLGPENLGVHDSVSVILAENDRELIARRITRHGNAEGVLRARVSDMHWWRGPKVLRKRQASVFAARSARYNGVPVAPWRLRFLLRAGDEMTLRFDDRGGVLSTEVRNDDRTED